MLYYFPHVAQKNPKTEYLQAVLVLKTQDPDLQKLPFPENYHPLSLGMLWQKSLTPEIQHYSRDPKIPERILEQKRVKKHEFSL